MARIEADIDRWFTPSPFGVLLTGDDGRVWRLTDEQAAELRGKAIADVFVFVRFEKRMLIYAIALLVVAASVFDRLAPLATAIGAPWLMLPFGLVLFAPLWPLVRMVYFRRRQRALKAAYISSLGNVMPFNSDAAATFTVSNPFKGIASLIIAIVFVGIFIAETFAARASEEMLGRSGLAWFIFGGIGLALVVHCLDRRTRKRDRE